MKKLLLALFIVVVVATWYASLLAAPSIDFNYEVIDDALEEVEEPVWFYDSKPGTDLA